MRAWRPDGMAVTREQDRERDATDGGAEDDRLPADARLERAARRSSGEASAPRLKKRWSRLSARPRPVRVEVEDEAVHPAVDGAAAEPERDRRGQEQPPGRDRREPGQAQRDEGHGERQDDAPPDPLGQQAAGHRAPDVGHRVDEEEDADAGVGLVERGLDRPDQRRDEQPGPADEQQPGAGEDQRRSSVRRGLDVACADANGVAPDCPAVAPGRVSSRHGEHRTAAHARPPHAAQAERRPVLRPRRERDLRGPGRDPRPDRGPGPGPRLGRHGRRARVAAPRPSLRLGELAEGDPPARPAVADAASRSCAAGSARTRS